MGNTLDLVKQINGIIDPDKVAAALKGKFPTNSDHLCTGANLKNKPYCSIIAPEVAGVIFDSNSYRATIFINPKYLQIQTANPYRPTLSNSTAGASYIANNNFAIATSSGNENYSLNNVSIFAKGNNAVNITSNLSQNVTPQSSQSTYTMQSAVYSRLQGDKYYQVGMFYPETGGGFLSAPMIAGASVQNYGIIPTQAQGNPIVLFLPLPSQVAIYRNGFLISSQSFDAGKQQLDTSTFPNGSYELTLKITNNIGQVTTQNEFFVKQYILPPSGSPNYQVSAGFIQSNSSASSNTQSFVLPAFTKVPLFTYNELRKLGVDFGLQSTLMTTFNRLYLTETITYYGVNWQIGPGVLVSNNQQYGWLLNATFTPIFLPSLQFTSNNQKITNSSASTNLNTNGPTNITTSNYSPLAQATMQSTNTLNWQMNEKTMLGFSGTYNKNTGVGGMLQYGATVSRTLFSSPLLSLTVSSSVLKSTGQDAIVSVQFSSSFNTVSDINVGLGVGYGNSNTINNSNGSTYNVYKPNYSESVSKTKTWGENNTNSFLANATFNQNYTSNTNQLTLNYTSQLLAADFTYNHTISKQYTNTGSGPLQLSTQTINQMSANIFNNIAITSAGVGSGYMGGNLAGVMADVVAPKGVNSSIFINGQNYGTVKSNSAKAFFLPAYQTYQVTIQPDGASQYGFDTRPKEVTIYNGNMQTLKWTLSKQYVLFAQIVDQNGKPMSNLLMLSSNPGEFNTTDDTGYIQASLPEDATSLSFQSMSGGKCTVTLDPKQMQKTDQNDLVVLDKPLVCK